MVFFLKISKKRKIISIFSLKLMFYAIIIIIKMSNHQINNDSRPVPLIFTIIKSVKNHTPKPLPHTLFNNALHKLGPFHNIAPYFEVRRHILLCFFVCLFVRFFIFSINIAFIRQAEKGFNSHSQGQLTMQRGRIWTISSNLILHSFLCLEVDMFMDWCDEKQLHTNGTKFWILC